MTSSKWDSSDIIITLALTLAVGLILLLIGSGYSAAVREEKYKKACLIAGGVPLHEQCIRPGAFMEVNP